MTIYYIYILSLYIIFVNDVIVFKLLVFYACLPSCHNDLGILLIVMNYEVPGPQASRISIPVLWLLPCAHRLFNPD